MGREYDDGVPIRRHTRPPGGHPAASVVGGLLAILIWGGMGVAAVAAINVGQETGDPNTPLAFVLAAALWVVGTVGGCIGWAGMGSRPGVAAFRIASVSGILTFFLAVPCVVAGCRVGQEMRPAPGGGYWADTAAEDPKGGGRPKEQDLGRGGR